MAYQRYFRVAAVVFALYTVYPVVTKLLDGRLAHDWAHSVLHLVSALFAVYAGWLARSLVSAVLFTAVIGVVYLALGVYGWFTPGLLLSTPFAIPLGPVDNVFHLALSVPALVILAVNRFSVPQLASGRRR
jgi:hypothetical protein